MKGLNEIIRGVEFILWSSGSMGSLKDESDRIGATF